MRSSTIRQADFNLAVAVGGGPLSHANHRSFLLDGVRKFGASAIFLVQLLGQSVPALARPRLIVYQIYNAGARSLIIIMLAGLFVGMVLGPAGLQPAATLRLRGHARVPPRRSDLLRELGPVVTALLFAGRAGTALTSEIGLMRAHRSARGHGDPWPLIR